MNIHHFYYLDEQGNVIAMDQYEECEADLHARWCESHQVRYEMIILNEDLAAMDLEADNEPDHDELSVRSSYPKYVEAG